MKVWDEKQYKDVLKDLVRGMTISQVAKKYNLAEITVYKYIARAEKNKLIKRDRNVDYIKKGRW